MDAAIATIKKNTKPGAAQDAAVAAVRSIGKMATTAHAGDSAELRKALATANKTISAMAADVNDLKARNPVADAMKEIAARDTLAKQLVPFVGAFDASDKSLADVQAYGLDKLGLKADKGQEAAVLTGYLAAAVKHAPKPAAFAFAGDGTPKKAGDNAVSAYLNKK
jgi:hypothetical protein